MNLYDWKDSYSVEISSIDDDHKGLYSIYHYVAIKSIFLLPLHVIKAIYSDLNFLRVQTL